MKNCRERDKLKHVLPGAECLRDKLQLVHAGHGVAQLAVSSAPREIWPPMNADKRRSRALTVPVGVHPRSSAANNVFFPMPT
jgi:hypothetical protein